MLEALLFAALSNSPAAILPDTDQLATALYESPFLASQNSLVVREDALRVPLVLRFNEETFDYLDEIKLENAGSREASDHLSRDYLIARRFRWFADHEQLQRSGTQVPPAWENPTFF